MPASMQTERGKARGDPAPLSHRLIGAAGLLAFAPILAVRFAAQVIWGRRAGGGLDRLLRASGLDALAGLQDVANGRRRWEDWRARAAVQFLYTPARQSCSEWASGRRTGDKPS